MTVAALAGAALSARGMTMNTIFALCGLATIPVAMAAAWILRRELVRSAMRLALRLVYRVRVEGVEHVTIRSAESRHCGEPRVVPRRAAARRIPAGRSHFRGRHPDREEVVGEAVPVARERAAGRSHQPAVDPLDDSRGRAGRVVRDFSRRAHHHDGLADEGVRRPRGDCRADGRRAGAGAHRWRGVHAVLTAGREGAPPPVSEDSHSCASPDQADDPGRASRPGTARGAAPRAWRRNGEVHLRGRSRRYDAVRRAARGAASARRRASGRRRHRSTTVELPRAHHRELRAWVGHCQTDEGRPSGSVCCCRRPAARSSRFLRSRPPVACPRC